MQRPSFLASEASLDALCHHFNVMKASYPAGIPLPTYFDMPIMRDAHMPTHVLASYQTDSTSTPPLMVPVDAGMFSSGFRVDWIPLPPPGSTLPVPTIDPSSGIQIVSLPVVPITVPHLPSLPLLLLFGLGLERQTNLLALRLLPPEVIEEFPNAAAMAQVMSRIEENQFQKCLRYNQGAWKNVLALGMYDTSMVELVRTAWNVTAEARRIRHRA